MLSFECYFWHSTVIYLYVFQWVKTKDINVGKKSLSGFSWCSRLQHLVDYNMIMLCHRECHWLVNEIDSNERIIAVKWFGLIRSLKWTIFATTSVERSAAAWRQHQHGSPCPPSLPPATHTGPSVRPAPSAVWEGRRGRNLLGKPC